jgi:hypothetical protein
VFYHEVNSYIDCNYAETCEKEQDKYFFAEELLSLGLSVQSMNNFS